MIKEQFVTPAGYKKWSLGLMGVGVLALIYGFICFYGKENYDGRFWGGLLYNSVFFLLITNAAMFFICATTLAMGGWQMAFRRLPEAISTCVKIFVPVTALILGCIVFMGKEDVYHWLNPHLTDKTSDHYDKLIDGKSGFLNKTFFTAWTALTLIGWWALGAKMRRLSRQADEKPFTLEEGKKYIFKNTIWGAAFIVWFALTVASTVPWLWLMSIDAHWYSTMYSWYTFASSFVAGMALIAIYFVYLKGKGYLEYATEEHLHDLGKFMFAFSVFWTYLWFSQYMLIWYANIPEETTYFEKWRVHGPYKGLFFLNLVLNFVAPLLILMKRGVKRNYMLVTIMACVIIFGHWIDFFQMTQPGIINNAEHAGKQIKPGLGFFEFGIAAGFIGMIMWQVASALSKAPLLVKHHPFVKESIVHHT